MTRNHIIAKTPPVPDDSGEFADDKTDDWQEHPFRHRRRFRSVGVIILMTVIGTVLTLAALFGLFIWFFQGARWN